MTTKAKPSSESTDRLETAHGLGLIVRPVDPADHAELYNAFAALVLAGEGYPQAPGPLEYHDFADYWLLHKSHVAVARTPSDDALAGSYYLRPNFPGRAAHIANAGYFVVPGLRNQGVGSALVTHSLDQARRLGFDALQFNLVFSSNPARRLYERLGFQVVGRVPEAIEGEDALIYWRKL